MLYLNILPILPCLHHPQHFHAVFALLAFVVDKFCVPTIDYFHSCCLDGGMEPGILVNDVNLIVLVSTSLPMDVKFLLDKIYIFTLGHV